VKKDSKVRIQLDLPSAEAKALDAMKDKCGLRSRADTVRTALALFEWARRETEAGRQVVAVGPNHVSKVVLAGLAPE